MKILVTGGAGYIGSHAVHVLISQGHHVAVLDDLTTGHQDSIHPSASFIQGGLHDTDAVKRALDGCEAVMHFAGKSIVGDSVTNPQFYWEQNVGGSANLLDSMRQVGVTKLIFSSTAATYGNPEQLPITEDAPTHPTNPYGETKLAIDNLIAERAPVDGLSAISLRYFNVSGAGRGAEGWLAERHNPETHLIPNLLHATPDNPVSIFGTDWPTKDGTCIRDYVHVIDLVEAHVMALNVLLDRQHQIINLGSGSGFSVLEVLKEAERVLGHEIPHSLVGRRAGDPAILVAGISKAESVLGWKPTRSLHHMVSDTWSSMQ